MVRAIRSSSSERRRINALIWISGSDSMMAS